MFLAQTQVLENICHGIACAHARALAWCTRVSNFWASSAFSTCRVLVPAYELALAPCSAAPVFLAVWNKAVTSPPLFSGRDCLGLALPLTVGGQSLFVTNRQWHKTI